MVNRENVSPEVSADFELAGHIEKKPSPKPVGDMSSEVPSLASNKGLLPPIPSSFENNKKYSVSAVGVPINDLLFKLAQDANKQLDDEEKNKAISEDQRDGAKKEIDELTKKYTSEVDEHCKKKTDDVMNG